MLRVGLVLMVMLGFNGILSAQTRISRTDGIALEHLQLDYKDGCLDSSTIDKYPIHTIKDRYYLSFLAKINLDFDKPSLERRNCIIGNPVRDIVSIKIPLTDRREDFNIQGIEVLAMADKISHRLDKTLKDTRADSVHQGIDLPQGFTGKNVYIGVTDWGFDYTHPVFYDTALNQTRIV
ncbi:MAG: hypothetical protein ACKO5L_10720, partial [Bacteroidota bacterium]